MQAEMKIRVLKDGTIKVTTEGTVPEEHHQNAEEFLNFVAEKAGGERCTEHLDGQHQHDHHVGHTHGNQQTQHRQN